MKKVVYGITVVCLLVVGFGGGWLASQATVTQRPIAPSNTPLQTEKFRDTASGTGMDPSELYSELQKKTGPEFDSQYIAYVILMENTLTGMNRLAKERSVNEQLKTKATDMWAKDTQTTTELYALQKSLGYAHH